MISVAVRVTSTGPWQGSLWICLTIVYQDLDELAVIKQRADRTPVMETADDPSEQLGDIGLDVPLLVQQVVTMEDCIRADDPIENPFLVCSIEILDGIGVEQGKADHADDLLGTKVGQFTHGDDHGATGGEHIVGNENGLSVDIAKQVDALDIGMLRILADDGVVAFLVQHGQRPVEGLGVKLVPADRTGIGGDNHQVRVAEIDEFMQGDQGLVGRMQIFQMQIGEAVLNFPAMDIECDDPFNAEHFANPAEHGRCQGFPPTFLMLTGIRIGRKDQRHTIGSGKLEGVDRSEEEHQVVVHRQPDRLVRPCNLYRLAVGYIINDENPQTPDCIEYFCFLFPIGKPGILHLDGKIRALERCGALVPGNTLVVQVIHQGNGSQDLILAHTVALCQGGGEFFVALQIETAKVLHNLAGEIF